MHKIFGEKEKSIVLSFGLALLLIMSFGILASNKDGTLVTTNSSFKENLTNTENMITSNDTDSVQPQSNYSSLNSPQLQENQSSLNSSETQSNYSFRIDIDPSNNSLYNAEAINGTICWSSINASAIFNSLPSGKIYIANGQYYLTNKVYGKNGQYFVGESMGAFDNFSAGVNLIYVGGQTDSFFDFRDCRSFGLNSLKLINSSGSAKVGLCMGGSANNAEKSKALSFINIVVDGFPTGIAGYTYGPDDSSIYDSYIGNASEVAVDHLSSQFRFFGCSIYSSEIGVRIYRNSGESADASMIFTGTTWSGAKTAIDIIGNQSINEITLTGCWIETCAMILRTTNAQAGITIGTVDFYNTIATVNSDTFMDLSGRNIQLTFKDGELYPTNGIGAQIITNGEGGTYQRLSVNPLAGSDLIIYSDSNSGLSGQTSDSFILYNDANGYTNTAFNSSLWQRALQDLKNPITGSSIVKAIVYYRWNPQSTSGGIALSYGGYQFGIIETAVSGDRVDSIDVTAYLRANLTLPGGELGFSLHGDGAIAPTVYYIEILYEW